MATGGELLGLAGLLARILGARTLAELSAAKGLYARGLAIFEKSQVLVPVDTGTLRGSGQVTPPFRSGSGWEVQVGYGGAASAYAIYVHEITTSQHAAPTQAKFLEQPALEEAARFGAGMAVEFKGLFG